MVDYRRWTKDDKTWIVQGNDSCCFVYAVVNCLIARGLSPPTEASTAEMKSPHGWKRPDSQLEGVCRLHHKDGWTALAFWDRSGDSRRNSCSVVIMKGEHDFATMVEIFEQEFPGIHARCTAKFELVEEVRRCEVTGNPIHTGTRAEGDPCKCGACR